MNKRGFVVFPVILIALLATVVVGGTIAAVKHFTPQVATAASPVAVITVTK